MSCFQINRQPDPYSSHCVDSWENTGINVPEGMEYSLAVRTTSFRRSLMLVVSTIIREADKKKIVFFRNISLVREVGFGIPKFFVAIVFGHEIH